MLCALAGTTHAKTFKSPDIVVVGDSQISFGAGANFLKFFENLETVCKPDKDQRQSLKRLGNRTVAAIGVRSTSLHSWIAKTGKSKGTICDVDKRWGVNAGTYGLSQGKKRKYVQIGKGSEYQFCKRNKSAFDSMFAGNYYAPKLMVMAFLGNAADRWAGKSSVALKDVQQTMRQIPKDLPCIFMTTAPSYLKGVNATRLSAQKSVKRAFDKSGSRCSFVEGFTPDTIASSTGNKRYFKTSKSGKVSDPHHPNARGSKAFFAIKSPDLCRAVFQQLTE